MISLLILRNNFLVWGTFLEKMTTTFIFRAFLQQLSLAWIIRGKNFSHDTNKKFNRFRFSRRLPSPSFLLLVPLCLQNPLLPWPPPCPPAPTSFHSSIKNFYFDFYSFMWVDNKALQNWKISVKALSKRLRKLMIITKRLIAIIIISFININD